MEFTKMQGLGNDFIVINNMKLKLSQSTMSILAKRLCKRKISIGADGFMVVDFPDGDADFKMRFYNSDGSIGEMCGNGARCIARYAFVNKLAEKQMKIETASGIVYAEVLDGRKVKVQLSNPSKFISDVDIEVNNEGYECSYIELGNPGLPHAIVNYPNLKYTEISQIIDIGRKLRYHEYFPKGANINFYEIIDDTTAIIKTYERGVEDFTYACGTGSASTAVALILKGYIKGNSVKIINPGGELTIEVGFLNNRVEKLFLIGDTNIVSIGHIMDEDIKDYIDIQL